MNRAEAAAILGVSQSATHAEIRTAFKANVRLLHPDRLANLPDKDRETANAAFQRLLEARAILLNDSSTDPMSARTEHETARNEKQDAPHSSSTSETRHREPREEATATAPPTDPKAAQTYTTHHTSLPTALAWSLFAFAGVMFLLTIFGPPDFLEPGGAIFSMLLFAGWVSRALGNVIEQRQKQVDDQASNPGVRHTTDHDYWNKKNQKTSSDTKAKRTRSSPEAFDHQFEDPNISTEFEGALFSGKVDLTFRPNGKITINTYSRDDESPINKTASSDFLLLVTCLSAWIRALGQTSRNGLLAPFDTLLRDLELATETALEEATKQKIRLPYLLGLPRAWRSAKASVSVYFTPDGDVVAAWEGWRPATDVVTLRTLVGVLFESALREMHYAPARLMTGVGCSAICAAIRRDHSVVANHALEGILLANVFQFIEDTFDDEAEASKPATYTENAEDAELDEAWRSSKSNDDDEFVDVIDRASAMVRGTGPWLRPPGVKVAGTALLHGDGIYVELSEDEGDLAGGVLDFPWSGISGWKGADDGPPVTIFSLGLIVEISGDDLWSEMLRANGIIEKNI